MARKLRFKAPSRLNDLWARDGFPIWQTRNRKHRYWDIELDFSSVTWINPLPLLLIITELVHTSDHNRDLTIKLGRFDSESARQGQNRAIRYAIEHGLLSALSDSFLGQLKIVFEVDGIIRVEDRFQEVENLVRKLQVDLLFGDIAPIPMRVLAFPNQSDNERRETLRSEISSIVRKADWALYKYKTATRVFRNTTLHRLNQILLELVENAFEHGYPNTELAHVGIYSRYVDLKTKKAFDERERDLRESFSAKEIRTTHEPIEIMVCDVGHGLYRTLSLKYKNRLHPGASGIFLHPCSSYPRTKDEHLIGRGEATGLMHVNDVLAVQQDRSIVYSNTELLSTTHPRVSKTSGWRVLKNAALQGTAFHIGLTATPTGLLPADWFDSVSYTSKSTLESVVNAITQPDQDGSVPVCVSLKEFMAEANPSRLSLAHGRAALISLGKTADKNTIYNLVRRWCESVSAEKVGSEEKRFWLVLCELGRYQSVDIDWMLQRLQLRTPPELRASLCLVTEDVSLSLYTLDSRTSKFVQVRPSDSQTSRIIEMTLRSLRKRDTHLLAKRIDELEAMTHKIVFEDVEWSVNSRLPLYLDFATIIQDSIAAKITRRALRRFLALFPHSNDRAVDSVVDATLHDARKWLVRPTNETEEVVLVGSVSVSGGTLTALLEATDKRVAAVIDCIQGPTFNYSRPTGPKHVFALSLPPVTSPGRSGYIRHGNSPFIRKREHRSPAFTQNPMYSTPGIDRLLKIGHWCYADRHSLLDINPELIMDQSVASRAGAVQWLAKHISMQTGDVLCIVFPLQKHAYRLAHLVRAELERIADERIIILQPLSFLPRVSGGVARFIPVVEEQLRDVAPRAGQCVFLDVGYLSGRTWRHSYRQLRAIGFSRVSATGLLNRSSIPEQEIENSVDGAVDTLPYPVCFWRWSVGAMGTDNRCVACSAIRALKELRESISKSHGDLLPVLDRIVKEWSAKDMADFWGEYGLESMPLLDVLINDEVIQGVQSTGSVSSFLVEHARVTGNFSLGISYVEQPQLGPTLDDAARKYARMETAGVLLLLCGSGMSREELLRVAKASLDLALEIEKELLEFPSERCFRILGLLCLSLIGLAPEIKAAIASSAGTREMNPRSLPVSAVILSALWVPSDSSLVTPDRFLPPTLKLKKLGCRQSIKVLTEVFGRAPQHSSSALIKPILESGNQSLGFQLGDCRSVAERVLKKLRSIDEGFALEAFEIDVDKLVRLGAEAVMSSGIDTLKSWCDELQAEANTLHSQLLRIEGGPVGSRLNEIVVAAAESEEVYEIVPDRDAAKPCWDAASDYLVVGRYYFSILREVFNNIRNRSLFEVIPRIHPFSGSLGRKCFACYTFESDANHAGVTTTIVSRMKDPECYHDFSSRHGFAKELGLEVFSRRHKEGVEEGYYVVSVRVACLRAIGGG